MALTHSARNRMVVATVVILALGGACIAWEFMRGRTAAAGGSRTPGARFDPTAVQEVIDDPRMRSLVPLAPPIVPKVLGNPAPFPVPEQRE